MSDTLQQTAESRVDARLGFYSHALIYTAVIGLLWLINAAGSAETWWAIWPTAGWGIGLLAHGLRVSLRPSWATGTSLRQRMIRAELTRLHETQTQPQQSPERK